MAQWGLMLVNLGTPDAPEVPAVRRYLREFLSDLRVVDIPATFRWLLVNLVIVPFRARFSAEAYRKIWTARGSPLLYHSLDLVESVQALLGIDVQVELAMRYQSPSITSALSRFRDGGIDRIVVFPLFPQYSSATWVSSVEKVFSEASRRWNMPAIQVVPPFYDHPAFIDAVVAAARPVLDDLKPDKVVMSFHGTPVRHIMKSDQSAGRYCLQSEDCCERLSSVNRNCYRAQCYATARALAAELDLDKEAYAISFQSRLGRSRWVKPYTDQLINELADGGLKRIAVICPSFVADCLETLEEIGIRAREAFLARGGEKLYLVPSLNSQDLWAQAVVQMARETLSRDAGLDMVKM